MDHLENLEEFNIPEEAIEKLKDPKYLKESLSKNIPLQEVLFFTEETMHKFYTYAHLQYQKQEYELASEGFLFLTTLNPFVYRYWLGLGMSEELSQDYHGALLAYKMAARLEKQNPLVYYHIANCYRGLLDEKSSMMALKRSLEFCRCEHASLKESILTSLSKSHLN